MKRVFFVECSGSLWRTIAQHCVDKEQWQPVLWTAQHADVLPITKMFPEVFFLAGTDAALGLSDDSAPWPNPALDADLLEVLAPVESIALHMMDRMDPACGAGFSHDDRRRHYYRLLRYWVGALNDLKPDLIIFSIAPHIVFDYILFALARHRGIPTIMFERIGLPGWVFPMSDYEQGSVKLRKHLQENPVVKPLQLPPAFQKWLEASREGGATVPANFQKKLERYKLEKKAKISSLPSALLYEFKRAIALLSRYGMKPALNAYLRSKHFPHGHANHLETLLSRLRGLFAKRRLLYIYDKLSTSPSDGENYVLLGLHYQPERATVPMGGAFGDQTLIVDMLASSLPPGWKLYIKEHPWQLQSFGRGEVQRTEAFYAELTRRDEAILLPRQISTAAMVRGARAVATVTGSVGWEAVCSGIPVLTFGTAWYSDCEGVYRIRNQADLANAMSRILLGEQPQLETTTAFCAALAAVCVEGVLEPDLERTEYLTQEEAASSMAETLMNFGHGDSCP